MEYTPEQQLVANIVLDAISVKDNEWLSSDSTDYLFSFVNCCSILDLDPSAVRHAALLKTKPKAPDKVKDMLDKGYSHPYVKQLHCKECKQGYWIAYANKNR